MVGPVVAVEVAGKSFQQAVREFECRLIAEALTRTNGNKAQAARDLGIGIEKLGSRLAGGGVRLVAVIE